MKVFKLIIFTSILFILLVSTALFSYMSVTNQPGHVQQFYDSKYYPNEFAFYYDWCPKNNYGYIGDRGEYKSENSRIEDCVHVMSNEVDMNDLVKLISYLLSIGLIIILIFYLIFYIFWIRKYNK